MNIVCTICSDLANLGEHIHVTKCGHLFHYQCLSQWLSRSKSCPQCRNKVTEECTYHLYPTISNESTGVDPATLLATTNASFKEKNEKLLTIEKELKKNVALLKATAVSALQDQLEYVNIQNKETQKLREENESLRNKIQTLSGALRESENEKNQLQDKLQMIEQQLAMEKSNNATLQNKILILEQICESENKKNQLQNKLQMIEQQLAMAKSNNATLQNKILILEQICESENKKNQLQNKLQMIEQQLAMAKSNNATLQNKILMPDNPKSKRKSLTDDSCQTVKKIKILNDGVIISDNNISIDFKVNLL